MGSDDEYTKEELMVLASLRQRSGRVCRNCRWLVARGTQRGCFPENKYRKWLSREELRSGCQLFSPREQKE
jgi:hypothetical protein